MQPRFRLASLLFVLAGPALAQGTPRSIGECERLKNDLAYNQCLAMFGPAAKNIAGGDGGASAPAPSYSEEAIAAAGIPSADEPELAEPTQRGRRGRYGRRGGRQSMSFAVATAGSDEAVETGSRRSHRYRYRRSH